MFVCRDISLVLHTHKISLPKTMNMISTDDYHEFILVFMLYYYCFAIIDFKGLCVLKSLLVKQKHHNLA